MALTRRTIIEGAAAFGVAGAALTPTLPAMAQARRTAPDQVDQTELMVSGPLGDCVLGQASAPVTIVEYASLTCGHCATFHTTILPELKAKYIDTGKVKLVFREFPLNQLDAAVYMLTRCALGEDGKSSGDQARYFALISVFFQQQRTWAFGSDPLAAVTAITRQAGFTQAQFEACLNNQPILDALNQVRERASTVFAVDSTPTFFVNGKRVLGAQPLSEFDKLITPLLPV